MTPSERLLAAVLDDAIAAVRAKRTPVYTFAFYDDHESAAISVCVDTEASSESTARASNQYSAQYFRNAITEGDLEGAALWNANSGRSLSLGDFALVNVARRDLTGPREPSFHLLMVRTLMAREKDIVALAADPAKLMFCCSGPGDEVQYVWAPSLG